MYVDVHTHLTHKKFRGDQEQVIQSAIAAGLGAIVVNGLEPSSNREILQLAAKFPVIKPALGIYPIDAVNGMAQNLPFPVATFNVDEEIKFIEESARDGKLAAVGECGLDGHWVGAETFAEQERVLAALSKIANQYDLPLIVHTRKREERSFELLKHLGARKVNFHCYGGRVKSALRAAEEESWYFSIPANARHNEAFTKMLKELPPEKILTETDAPYLAPVKGTRNEPGNVVDTVAYLSELRGWTGDEAKEQVWKNYQRLFGTHS